jgi:hypothetical protein
METLLENPLPAILIGGPTALLLAAIWLKTGSRWLLGLLLGVLAITLLLVLVEKFVVTDREQITATLYRIAELVEQNDFDAAVEYAHSDSELVRGEALAELANYEFSLVDIKHNLEIQVFPDETVPRAEADFNVVVVVSKKNSVFTDQRVPRFVEVTFHQEDDGAWRVAGYRHYEPYRGFRKDPDEASSDEPSASTPW